MDNLEVSKKSLKSTKVIYENGLVKYMPSESQRTAYNEQKKLRYKENEEYRKKHKLKSKQRYNDLKNELNQLKKLVYNINDNTS